MNIPTDQYEIFYQTSLNPDVNFNKMMGYTKTGEPDYENGCTAIVLYSNLEKYEKDFHYAPQGHSVITLTGYANPYDVKWQDTDAVQTRAAELVSLVEKEFPGIKDHIMFNADKKYIVASPADIEGFTNQFRGIPYGWSWDTKYLFNRLLNHNKIPGFYLAGSWTLPGMGVNTAQLSGMFTSAWLFLDFIRHSIQDYECFKNEILFQLYFLISNR